MKVKQNPTEIKKKKVELQELKQLWESLARAPKDHPYLVHKKVNRYRCRVTEDRLVLLIRHAVTNKFMTVQYITPEGDKRFPTGSKTKGGCCILGSLDNNDPIVICEGYATGASIRQATKWPVAVTFYCENLLGVAEAMRKRFSKRKIIIAADNDRETLGNPGVTKATAAARFIKGYWAKPPLCGDFNDYAVAKSLKAVKKVLINAKRPKKVPKLIIETNTQLKKMKLASNVNLLDPWLPEGGLCLLYAPKSTGKSLVALGVAYAVITGKPFLGWTPRKQGNVLYIDAEMGDRQSLPRIHQFEKRFVREGDNSEFNIEFVRMSAQKDRPMPDLSTLEGQAEIDALIKDDTVLVIIDTVRKLCRSIDEDSNNEQKIISQWSLKQRAHDKAVLFLHHANKKNDQSGASARKDDMDTVIRLQHPPGWKASEGCVFDLTYTDSRAGYGPEFEPFTANLWHKDGVNHEKVSDIGWTTQRKVLAMLQENPKAKQKEIAEELGISAVRVNQIKKRAEREGTLYRRTRKRRSKRGSGRYGKD